MAKDYVAEGHVVCVLPTRQITESFRVREIVLEIDRSSEYPQLVSFQAVQDKADRLDDVKEGDEIQVEFDLRGRKWINREGEAKFFTTLHLWRWKLLNRGDGEGPNLKKDVPTPSQDDDIPF